MGERALKLMVILLSSINAVTWLMYTESTFMATVWGGTALGFVYWIIADMRR